LIGCANEALARLSGAAYLKGMAQPVLTHHDPVAAAPSARVVTAIVWGGAGLASFAAIGALALWFHYGTAVFFEMIASGISACF
jgi:multisubunit Na+/H+ antiporter MnhC subunit